MKRALFFLTTLGALTIVPMGLAQQPAQQDTKLCVDAGLYFDRDSFKSSGPGGMLGGGQQDVHNLKKKKQYAVTFTYLKVGNPIFSSNNIQFRPIAGGGVRAGGQQNKDIKMTTTNQSITTPPMGYGGYPGGMNPGVAPVTTTLQNEEYGKTATKSTEVQAFAAGGFQVQRGRLTLGAVATVGYSCLAGSVTNETQLTFSSATSGPYGPSYGGGISQVWQQKNTQIEQTLRHGFVSDVCPFGEVAVNKNGTVNLRVSYTARMAGKQDIHFVSQPVQVGVSCRLK